MAESRFQEEMDDWEDHPGSIEALLHVDAQLHDDPLGYTTWEASGPLAGLLTAATCDEGTHDAEAEARAVAGFSVARALDDDNFYGRGRKSGKQRRTVRHAALAGVLAAGVLSATSGLAAAAHTSVVKVVSDIADGLRSSGPAHGQSPRPVDSPSTTPNPPSGDGGDLTRVAASDTAPSCRAGVDPSVSGGASANAACGSVSHGAHGNAAPTTNGERARRATAPGATMRASGPGDSSTGGAAKMRSRSAGGAVAGSRSGSHKTFSSGSGSGGGSVSGGGSGSKTGNGTGSGTHAVGHLHHHHHHHHVDIGVGDSTSGSQ